MHSCQPVMTKIFKKVGFSVKKRGKLIKRAKITQFRVKNAKFVTFGGMKKRDKSGTVGNLAPKRGTVPPK